MSNRAASLLAVVGVALAILVGYINWEFASSAHADFERFRTSICQLQAQQAKGSGGFIKLLQSLDNRAVAREHLDAANGNATAAAADADSARLYQSVLDQYAAAGTHPHVSVC